MSVADLYDAALVLTNPSGMMVKPKGDEIERMRIQVHRQRGEIKQLQRAGIPTASAEALLDRMLNSIDGLCAARDRLKKEQPGPCKGKVLGGRRW